jgi:hypothetical protein
MPVLEMPVGVEAPVGRMHEVARLSEIRNAETTPAPVLLAAVAAPRVSGGKPKMNANELNSMPLGTHFLPGT